MRWATLPLLLITPLGLFAQGRIAFIKFFGYQGIDLQAIRQALPFREGDALRPEEIADKARSTVQRITGRSATDINAVCCVGRGNSTIFIGLPGASSHSLPFDPAPQGVMNPPAELSKLSERLQRAETEALRSSPIEDGAVGYRLLKEPTARAAEIALHEYAVVHEEEILSVLTESGDAAQRAMAAEALGFGGRTPRQLVALARAVRDPDALVRNNATRAIVEIVRADPSSASQIPPDNFIQMLRSGTWTDRNKGSAVLMYLTQSRDPVLLRRIQSEAGDALLEMAAWHPLGQAMPALMILARMAGRSDG
jgi:hypothetical protein